MKITVNLDPGETNKQLKDSITLLTEEFRMKMYEFCETNERTANWERGCFVPLSPTTSPCGHPSSGEEEYPKGEVVATDQKKETTCPEGKLVLATDAFLKQNYDLRHNILLGGVEYRRKAPAANLSAASAGNADGQQQEAPFRLVDKRALNSIAMDAHIADVRLWDRDLSRYVHSDRVPLFNPLEDFLTHLPEWDGTDRIDALASTVPCNNPYWKELFHRWFLSMVAHWRGTAENTSVNKTFNLQNINPNYANCVSPLLVGAQGTRKSTFCRNLLPPQLRSYYTDSIDFSHKRDAQLYLTRFALINMDEFDQITPAQQGFLKHVLQKPVVNTRKAYESTVQELRRYASFIATSNQKDLLTDPTGSRRFLCIEVTAPIDTSYHIDYDQLYAQALHEIAAGKRYWFDQKDELHLNESNHDFEQIPMEEQLFYRYFRPAKENEADARWLSPAEMLNDIRLQSRIPLSQKRVNVFGRLLQKHGITSKRVERGTVYCVAKIE